MTFANPSFIVILPILIVLQGRGAPVINNEGNKRFRELCRARKGDYSRATRHSAKDEIARDVLNIIASRGGRFLRRIDSPAEARHVGVPEGITAAWIEVDLAVALEKAKQTLRDKEPARSPPQSDGIPSAALEMASMPSASGAFPGPVNEGLALLMMEREMQERQRLAAFAGFQDLNSLQNLHQQQRPDNDQLAMFLMQRQRARIAQDRVRLQQTQQLQQLGGLSQQQVQMLLMEEEMFRSRAALQSQASLRQLPLQQQAAMMGQLAPLEMAAFRRQQQLLRDNALGSAQQDVFLQEHIQQPQGLDRGISQQKEPPPSSGAKPKAKGKDQNEKDDDDDVKDSSSEASSDSELGTKPPAKKQRR